MTNPGVSKFNLPLTRACLFPPRSDWGAAQSLRLSASCGQAHGRRFPLCERRLIWRQRAYYGSIGPEQLRIRKSRHIPLLETARTAIWHPTVRARSSVTWVVLARICCTGGRAPQISGQEFARSP
jgi:hypothetical protein